MTRIAPLEAARGLAALIVVIAHLSGSFPEFAVLLQRLRLTFLLDGGASIVFFFTLSGYVLTARYFATRDGSILARAALKRYPRLALPVLITCLASWLLFATNSYCYAEAGKLSGSRFLETFSNGVKFNPSLESAVLQGAVTTLIHGHNNYNTHLWTMRHELIGSLLVFGLAPLLLGRVGIWQFYAGVLMIAFWSIFMTAFLAGMLLAFVHSRWRFRSILFLLAGLFILFESKQFYAQVVGALCLIQWLVGSSFLDNRVGRFLGRISFPLYLLHGLVIVSAGSCVFVWTGAVWVAVCVTLLGSVFSAWVLSEVDGAWVKWLNGRAG